MASSSEAQIENRFGRDRNPVWEKVLTFAFVSTDTAEEKFAIPNLNGTLQKIIVKCSSATAADVLATVAIDDNGDNEVFSVANLVESTTYVYNVNEPLRGSIDVGVTPSKDPTSAYTVTVTLRGSPCPDFVSILSL